MSDESGGARTTESEDDGDRWLDWPHCPQCSRRRQTVCPTCHLAGDDFPLAEYIPVAETLGRDATVASDPGEAERPCCAAGSCATPRPLPPESGISQPSSGASESATPLAGPARHATPVLLMCPACDEAFAPRFYRWCAQCGFDFGEGIEIESAEVEPMNVRVLFAVVLVAAAVIGLCAYFWWLFGT